jgi:hypothetical protein
MQESRISSSGDLVNRLVGSHLDDLRWRVFSRTSDREKVSGEVLRTNEQDEFMVDDNEWLRK